MNVFPGIEMDIEMYVKAFVQFNQVLDVGKSDFYIIIII